MDGLVREEAVFNEAENFRGSREDYLPGAIFSGEAEDGDVLVAVR